MPADDLPRRNRRQRLAGGLVVTFEIGEGAEDGPPPGEDHLEIELDTLDRGLLDVAGTAEQSSPGGQFGVSTPGIVGIEKGESYEVRQIVVEEVEPTRVAIVADLEPGLVVPR